MTQDKYVFISYRRPNAAKAYELERRLMEQGVRVWIDKHGIEIGHEYSRKIQTAIQGASAFVLLWSEEAAEPTSYVHKEIALALAEYQQRPFSINVIVLPDAPSLPAILSQFHFEIVLRSSNSLKRSPSQKMPKLHERGILSEIFSPFALKIPLIPAPKLHDSKPE